jgi:HYR domain
VQDTTAPSITCPGPVTVECTGNNGISKNDPQLAAFFAGVSVSDICDPSLAPSNTAPGFFPLGTTSVTFSVTDDSGNTSTCSTSVKVADTLPPTIDASVSPTSLWPPNHRLVDITAAVAVQDICDPNPGFVLTSILSNEPDNGLGDGDTAGDIQGAAFGTPDTAFKLRAERSGNGTGRIYTVNYEASDGSGNKSTDSPVVLVPHNR